MVVATCGSCGTVGAPTESGACMACGAQLGPPLSDNEARRLPPPYRGQPRDLIVCPGCSARLEPGDKFCRECGRPYGAASLTSSRSTPTPAATAKPSQTSAGRAIALAGAAILATVLTIGIAVSLLNGDTDDGEGTAEANEAMKEPTLAERTVALGEELTSRLCPGDDCVDASTPGVVTIDTKPGGEYGRDLLVWHGLEAVAEELGVWSVADAKRMGETRALDGTLSSANGAVTWNYHPNSGLDIVVDVESLPVRG